MILRRSPTARISKHIQKLMLVPVLNVCYSAFKASRTALLRLRESLPCHECIVCGVYTAGERSQSDSMRCDVIRLRRGIPIYYPIVIESTLTNPQFVPT